MSFCVKCGEKVDDSFNYCPKCGAANNYCTNKLKYSQTNNSTPVYVKEKPEQNTDVNQEVIKEDTDGKNSEYLDIKENINISVLSYFGIPFFVPLLMSPKSPFVRYHANQGLLYLITVVLLGGIDCLLSALFNNILPSTITFEPFSSSLVGSSLSAICTTIVMAVVIALFIIGICNVIKGRKKPLPVIGKFTIIK